MNKPPPTHSCCNCQHPIEAQVYKYSPHHYEFALCISCQRSLRDKITATTHHTLALYFLLSKKGIAAQLEKFDGFKTIDIAVVEARLKIEVDGSHHDTKHEQAKYKVNTGHQAYQNRTESTVELYYLIDLQLFT